MATDKLKIQGNSRVGTAGKDGKAAPARKIKDPFEDDKQSQGPAQVKRAKARTEAPTAVTETEIAEQPKKVEPQVEPVKSGRSRLILQPKKLKKKDKKKKQ